MKDKDIKYLEWVYERMKYVHKENENYDYMIRFREILEALQQPAVVGRSEQLPILDRCGCEEPNEEPIKVCMNCNGYVE